MLCIDGAMGEGGGQVLRSSLSLSALSGKPVRVENIRANRGKPGLMRQHLTAVKAAAEVCDAQVEGADLGSRAITFRPRAPRAGTYRFVIGTAGSTTLVCQTVLPILLRTSAVSDLCFEGGTHNPMAPPFDFLERIYLPALRRLGASVDAELDRPGFFPAGGGRFTLRLEPPERLRRLVALEPPRAPRLSAWVVSSRLPDHVAEREARTLGAELGLPREAIAIRKVGSPSPGNVVCVLVEDDERPLELCTAFGRRGRPAEEVAMDAADQARRFLAGGVPVGEHLADQLLLPLSLSGGAFLTRSPSSHTQTNIEVVRRFLGETSVAAKPAEGGVLVDVVASQDR